MTTPTNNSRSPHGTDAAALDQWWKDAVVYQIYPRSFADSDGDGIGDLGGIIARLDYLSQLGIDVLWLSPVYRSPQDDNGYDISDYQDIDPVFGTLDEFGLLLDGAHQRGIKVVMDLVVNHTSDEHPWFVESRSSINNAKRDWYWWRPARPGTIAGEIGAEPTNWEASFSGSAWELDPTTDEYFLHLFSRKQPDLNWENPDVREAVYAMMRWWLDRGVDGFRMDVINFISKDTALPDGPVVEGRRYGSGWRSYISGPRIHEFLQEMHRKVFAGRSGQFLTVGETPGVTVADGRLFTDAARAELDMVFQFEHVSLDQGATKWDSRPLDLVALKGSLGRWQEALAEVGWNSLYWSNHDQPRAVSRFGDDGEFRVQSAKLLGTILHLHRGTPYVYQGEELGMTNAPFSTIDDFHDLESINHFREALAAGLTTAEALLPALSFKSRDNARTPMQWDASENAGFTTGHPWIAVNPNYRQINAAAVLDDPDSVFHHYRRLIELRHTEPAVAVGDFQMLLAEDPTIYAFTRRLGSVELLVVGNFASHHTTADIPDLPAWSSAELLIGNYPDVARQPTWPLVLRPWEALVYRRVVSG